jgi:hypothetical protein
MSNLKQVEELEANLNDYSPAVRAQALVELHQLACQGLVPLEPAAEIANLHCHTFFFQCLAATQWSGMVTKRRGITIGTVDFDVLDGVDEFLGACSDQSAVALE